MNSIKDIKLLYIKKEEYSEEWINTVTDETYQGTNYCKSIILQLEEKLSEIKNIVYKGQTFRIANEQYLIETTHGNYEVSFTIDTFDDRTQTQLAINILSFAPRDNYDVFLENFKIYLKKLLLKDWDMCTWVVDEQFEHLGMQLYPLIFKTENKIRGFVNRVLTHKFGTKWMNMHGLEDIIKGRQRSYLDFKRKVPEFNNINDFLICSTAESLVKLMKNSKIYENEITFTDSESLRIHEMLVEKKLMSFLKKYQKEE